MMERRFGNEIVQRHSNVTPTGLSSGNTCQTSSVANTTARDSNSGSNNDNGAANVQRLLQKNRTLTAKNRELGGHFDNLKQHYLILERNNEEVVTKFEEAQLKNSRLTTEVSELRQRIQALEEDVQETNNGNTTADVSISDDVSKQIEGLTVSNEILRDQLKDVEKNEQTLRDALLESQQHAQHLMLEQTQKLNEMKDNHREQMAGLTDEATRLQSSMAEAAARQAQRAEALEKEIQSLQQAAAEDQENKSQVLAAVRAAVEAEMKATYAREVETVEASLVQARAALEQTKIDLVSSQVKAKEFQTEHEKLSNALATAEAKILELGEQSNNTDTTSAEVVAERDAAVEKCATLSAQVEKLRADLRNAEDDKISAYRQSKRKIEELEQKHHSAEYGKRYAELVAENSRLQSMISAIKESSHGLQVTAETQRKNQMQITEATRMLSLLQQKLAEERATLESQKSSQKVVEASSAASSKMMQQIEDLNTKLAATESECNVLQTERSNLEKQLAQKILAVQQLTADLETRTATDEQQQFDTLEENVTLKHEVNELKKVTIVVTFFGYVA